MLPLIEPRLSNAETSKTVVALLVFHHVLRPPSPPRQSTAEQGQAAAEQPAPPLFDLHTRSKSSGVPDNRAPQVPPPQSSLEQELEKIKAGSRPRSWRNPTPEQAHAGETKAPDATKPEEEPTLMTEVRSGASVDHLRKVLSEIETVRTNLEARVRKIDSNNPTVETRTPRSDTHVALPLTFFLARLKAITSASKEPKVSFTVGGYGPHQWGEFSLDLFLATGREEGYYSRDVALSFFDAIQRAANEDPAGDNAGKFAWLAIYNDPVVLDEVNRKYGLDQKPANPKDSVDRVQLGDPAHGPRKDPGGPKSKPGDGGRIHIHLNVRPLDLKPDAVTGFTIVDGRVVPAPRTR